MAFSTARSAFLSPSSNSTSSWKYHVFLSFRGSDTRRGFIDHLYAALLRKGFITFKDDEELDRGEVIQQEILQAIEESLTAIVVLSENYASSTWCLDELQKILQSRNSLDLEVFPIFYGVNLSEIRYQIRRFSEAFRKHEERFADDKEKVQRWRDALTEVADLSGWDSNNRHEAVLIEEIVAEVWKKVQPKLLSHKDGLVGIDSKIKEVSTLLETGSEDVRFIGIWGMGGIGKTTLARVVYQRNRRNFEVICILENIREVSSESGHGLVHLQRELLSCLDIKSLKIRNLSDGKNTIRNLLFNKKVLLVLDDVSDEEQLENLAGDQEWFGRGSRIIVTTRDMQLLKSNVYKKYEMKLLNRDESLQLLCQKAFKRDQPKEPYLELSKKVVEYAGGHPLALKLLGSFLCERSESQWAEVLEKIKQVPVKGVLMKTLRISYDGLDNAYKTIFLDVACFFKGWAKDEVAGIFQDCDRYPPLGIEVLIEKSLVTNDSGELGMHDLLQEMGRDIVLEESPNDVGKRSRLWLKKEIDYVLRNNKGTEKIQAIVLNKHDQHEAHCNLHPEAFFKMCNLKLLMIFSNLQLPQGLKCLSSELKVLIWEECPLKVLPVEVGLDELVVLKMFDSRIKQLWNGPQSLEKLRIINLSNSKDLVQAPNFSRVPNLEEFILEDCVNLVQVHSSLGLLKKLVIVNLKGCKNLKSLPYRLEMNSLEKFILSGCSKVRKVPEFGENMKCLLELSLEETAISKLPPSIGYLTGLSVLKLTGCRNLVCLPNNIGNLQSLKILDIYNCSRLSGLPDSLYQNENLEELDMSGTAIRELLSSVNHFKNLKLLSLGDFTGLAPSQSWKLPLPFGCMFKFTRPPIPMRLMLPPSISGLSSLVRLELRFCGLLDESIPEDLGSLSSLEILDLSGNKFNNLPIFCISELPRLHYVGLSCCLSLRSLPQLPPLTSEIGFAYSPSIDFSYWKLWEFFGTRDFKQQRRQHTNSNKPALCMHFTRSEIPSWFDNENYFSIPWSSRYYPRFCDSYVSTIIDIPDCCRSSEWSGVAVCLLLQDVGIPKPVSWEHKVQWMFKAPDREYNWYQTVAPKCGIPSQNSFPHICILFFLFDFENRWQFPYRHSNQLQLILSVRKHVEDGVTDNWTEADWNAALNGKVEIKRCKWRVLCQEDINVWRCFQLLYIHNLVNEVLTGDANNEECSDEFNGQKANDEGCSDELNGEDAINSDVTTQERNSTNCFSILRRIITLCSSLILRRIITLCSGLEDHLSPKPPSNTDSIYHDLREPQATTYQGELEDALHHGVEELELYKVEDERGGKILHHTPSTTSNLPSTVHPPLGLDRPSTSYAVPDIQFSSQSMVPYTKYDGLDSSQHTIKSLIVPEHKKRLKEKIEVEGTLPEPFLQTHQKKYDNSFTESEFQLRSIITNVIETGSYTFII